MKIFLQFLIGLFMCADGYVFVSPYYSPGPGYLPPAYSFQQPSWGSSPAFPPANPYYNPQAGYGYSSSSAQGPGLSGLLTCSALSCGSLKGFRQCLASPMSPYQYFIFHPEAITDLRAYQRLRAFTTAHPNCYSQFCNRVCSVVPSKFSPQAQQSYQDFLDEDSLEGGATQPSRGAVPRGSWLSRQKDRLLQNDRWRAREFAKRSGVQEKVDTLCNRDDLVGKEIRLFCSECDAYLKSDRKMIPACVQTLHYKAPAKDLPNQQESKSNSGRRGAFFERNSGIGSEEDEAWGTRDLNQRQIRTRSRFQDEQQSRFPQEEREQEERISRRYREPERRNYDDEHDYDPSYYYSRHGSGYADRLRQFYNSPFQEDSEDDSYLEPEDDWGHRELKHLNTRAQRKARISYETEGYLERKQASKSKPKQANEPKDIEEEIEEEEKKDALSDTSSQKSGSSQRVRRSATSSSSKQSSQLTAENLSRLPGGRNAIVPDRRNSVASSRQERPQSVAESDDGFSELDENEEDE